MNSKETYGVIYLFEIKPNRKKQFIETWTAFTQLIIEEDKSFGSRLHQINENHFFAYALWPSSTHFRDAGNNGGSNEMEEIRIKQQKNIMNVTRIAEGKILKDLLNPTV